MKFEGNNTIILEDNRDRQALLRYLTGESDGLLVNAIEDHEKITKLAAWLMDGLQ